MENSCTFGSKYFLVWVTGIWNNSLVEKLYFHIQRFFGEHWVKKITSFLCETSIPFNIPAVNTICKVEIVL